MNSKTSALMEHLDLSEAIAALDALGCQCAIAEKN